MPYRLVSFSGDQTFELPEGRSLVVGRGVSSDIAIYDPTISRRHAELTVGADGVQVKDLGSSNGTCINGNRVSAGRLSPNDSVTFGKVLFQLKEMKTGGGGLRSGGFALPAAAAQNDAIVSQLMVSGGGPPGITSRNRSSGFGQLRVAAESAEERQAKKLSLLLDISQKLSAEFDLDKLLRNVVDMMFEVMNVDRVSILLRSETSGELVPTMSRSRLGDTEFQHVPRSIADKVIQERVAVVSDNTRTDSRFKGQSIVMQSVKSAMCSPLMASGDQVLGILYVDSVTAANSFTDEDLQFLVAFSGLAALGIRNSRYADQVRREALVRSNFERYFAPNIAAEIAQQDAVVPLGGDRRPITILFSDIRGFTSMAESMGPDAIAQLLTEYFSEMVEIIFEHGGTLDKFVGDAIMALWGAPIAHADDADRALRAAVAMQQGIARLNERWVAAGRPQIGVGIGINYGEVFAGNIGSHRRLEYTVIGDAVNVANRLCSEAGPGEILVSEALCQVVKDHADYQYLPAMSLRGRTRTVEVYKLKRAATESRDAGRESKIKSH
jgi:adenylate cyclase